MDENEENETENVIENEIEMPEIRPLLIGLGSITRSLRRSRNRREYSGDESDESSHDWQRRSSSKRRTRKRSGSLLREMLGGDFISSCFQDEVDEKAQMYNIGEQEAEIEAVIDKLIHNEGSLEKALQYVMGKITCEWTVQVYVNILLNRGASTSCVDHNLRTPLHQAVEMGFKGVVNILLEHDALPDCMDDNDKMPVHIALEAENDDIASILIKYMGNSIVRSLFLYNSDVPESFTLQKLMEKNMQQSALAVLDCMIDQVGSSGASLVYYNVLEADDLGRPPSHEDFQKHSRSCLHMISNGGYKELVQHVVVRLLIRQKWRKFGRSNFIVDSLLYLITLVCLTFSVVVAVDTPDPTVYDTPLQYTRAVFELWSVIFVSLTLVVEIIQFGQQKMDYLRDTFNLMELGSSILLISVVPLRYTHSQEQWQVSAAGYLLWTLRVFKYASIFRETGAYAQILWKIISHDFLQFIVVFLVILLAFSGTFVLSLRGERSLDSHSETSSFWKILFVGTRILIEGQSVVDYTGDDGYEVMSCIIMVVFLFVCCVVLLNILIAQLSDTYQNVQKDAHKGLELNRAWIIARAELNSMLFGKGYRVTKYVEVDRIVNPENSLEQWESPIFDEIAKDCKELKTTLATAQQNILIIKNRLSRQEYALSRLQQQMTTLNKPVPPPTSQWPDIDNLSYE